MQKTHYIQIFSIVNRSGLTNTSCTYANLFDGTYEFTIQASNDYGSICTDSVIVQVQNFPTPFALSANVTISNNGDFILNWTQSTYANNYSIYLDSSLLVSGLTNNSYFIYGLTDDSYPYTVVALNGYGNTSSNMVTVFVQHTPLPLTLSASPPTSTNGTIFLSWTQSQYATNYSIYANLNLVASGLTSLSDILNGVTDGTYDIIVVAFNAYGNATSNTETLIVQNYPQPFTLSNVVSPNNNGSIVLNWTSSVNDATYTVYQNGIAIPSASGLTNLSYILNGLGDGTYIYTINASNGYGSVNSSSIIVQVQNFPTTFTLSPIQSPNHNGTITLSWTTSTYADNLSIYQGSTLLVSGLTNNSNLVSGLTDNSYTYTVVAFNIYGNATSDPVVVVVQRIPTVFTLFINPLISTDGTITLTWTLSQYAVNYSIYANSSLIASGLTGLSYTLNGLTDGTYNFTVEAFNSFGNITSPTVIVTVQKASTSIWIWVASLGVAGLGVTCIYILKKRGKLSRAREVIS